MLAITLPFFKARPAAVHTLVVTIVAGGILAFLMGDQAEALKTMGRKSDLTGRTEIWSMVIPMVPNSIVGAGFETFWCGPRVATFYEMHGGISMTNEAHNGYIEAYLNLGFCGLALIALILVHGYRSAVNAFRRDNALGALLLAYVVSALAYNIGEAGFRMLSLSWFFLLLSILAASRAMHAANRAPRNRLSVNGSSWPSESPSEFARFLTIPQRKGVQFEVKEVSK